ncbi:MAG: phosphatase PAP2 family protein [Ruminococcaceae bacterium]|nr:phosphatase PAP2 family protein [Oscillospiraceae bacterium]
MEENKKLNTEQKDTENALTDVRELDFSDSEAETASESRDSSDMSFGGEEASEIQKGSDATADVEEAREKPEYVPKSRYEKVLYSVYRDEGLSEILRVASIAIVALTAYFFFVHVLKLFEKGPLLALEALIITGVPFIALSVMRVLINAPRPYELFEFYEKKPKGKSGRSFPSRHVFSVFVIGTVLVPSNALLGIGILVLGAMLAAMRVLLGVHFIRDVAAGALIGTISGALGLLILTWI